MARGHFARRMLGAAAGLALLAPLSAAGIAHAAPGPAVPLATPNPGHLNSLSGVAAISPKNAWAVGDYCVAHCSYTQAQVSRSMILHWNGKAWSRAASPNPGSYDYLAAVSAVSASNVWAVGEYSGGGLILHWNGTSWSQAASGLWYVDNLAGVSARSANDVWAVGYQSGGNGGVILHWNGTTWSQVPNHSPGKNVFFSGVSADSATNAWAVGQSCVARCASRSPTFRGMTLRWNGKQWSSVALGVKNSRQVNGVAAVSPTNAWAVGQTQISPTRGGELFVHWNGKSWSKVKAPAIFPAALAFSSLRSGWAVGGTVFLGWNGKTWKVKVIKAPLTTFFGAASADRATDAWAVGNYCVKSCNGTKPVQRTIAVHWNGKRWSRT